MGSKLALNAANVSFQPVFMHPYYDRINGPFIQGQIRDGYSGTLREEGGLRSLKDLEDLDRMTNTRLFEFGTFLSRPLYDRSVRVLDDPLVPPPKVNPSTKSALNEFFGHVLNIFSFVGGILGSILVANKVQAAWTSSTPMSTSPSDMMLYSVSPLTNVQASNIKHPNCIESVIKLSQDLFALLKEIFAPENLAYLALIAVSSFSILYQFLGLSFLNSVAVSSALAITILGVARKIG